MRAPFQILVIPFRTQTTEPKYAVLKRRDHGNWQFVAGGGENNEIPLAAAQRETQEEIGLTGDLIKLDSFSSVPKGCFASADCWGPEVYVIPEYCFAVNVFNAELMLSSEHTEIKWLTHRQAHEILRWDSNRNALWELHERIKH